MIYNPFDLLSIPIDLSLNPSSTELERHVESQRALSDILSGVCSPSDFLDRLEASGVDVDAYMDEAIENLDFMISSSGVLLPI